MKIKTAAEAKAIAQQHASVVIAEQLETCRSAICDAAAKGRLSAMVTIALHDRVGEHLSELGYARSVTADPRDGSAVTEISWAEPQSPRAGSVGPGSNTGHGHVWARPDGVRRRCGGPKACGKCAFDAVTWPWA